MLLLLRKGYTNENIAFKASEGCTAYYNDEENITMYGYQYNWETAVIRDNANKNMAYSVRCIKD